MLEAIEIFVLLARVDPLTWFTAVDIMHLSCDDGSWRDPAWTRYVLESHPQRRVCGYELVCRLHDVPVVCAFLSARQMDGDEHDTAGSDEYKRVRALLEAELPEPVEIPVRLQIEPRLVHAKRVGEVLHDVAQLASVQNDFDSSRASQSVEMLPRLAQFRGRIRLVCNQLSSLTRADEPFLRNMMAIQANGVTVATLPELDAQVTQANSAFFVQTLNSLLGTASTSTTRRAVAKVHLSLSNSRATLIALLSAIADAETISYVTVNSPRTKDKEVSTADRQPVMQWLAYALLHSRSLQRRPINLGWCCSTLTTQDIQWMEQVLSADEPLQVLFAGEYDDVCAHASTRLATSKVSLCDPHTSDNTPVLEGLAFHNLRVLQRDQDWWTVLLPGLGPAWVHDSNATISSITPVPASTPSSSTHTVASLRSIDQVELTGLHCASRDPAFLLLQLIGPAVQRLHLSDSNRPRDNSFESVFDLCPNVHSLALCDMNPLGLASVADGFVSGRCRHLKNLTLAIDMMPYETLADISSLLHALADNDHAMARQLDVLEVNVNHMVDGESVVDSTVVEDALHMLENNTYLTFLKLSLPLATTVPERAWELHQALAKHNNVVLPEPCVALGPREKAAFLSVVWGPRGQKTTLQQLNQSVVSSIFEWTLYPRHRRVEVSMPRLLAV